MYLSGAAHARTRTGAQTHVCLLPQRKKRKEKNLMDIVLMTIWQPACPPVFPCPSQAGLVAMKVVLGWTVSGWQLPWFVRFAFVLPTARTTRLPRTAGLFPVYAPVCVRAPHSSRAHELPQNTAATTACLKRLPSAFPTAPPPHHTPPFYHYYTPPPTHQRQRAPCCHI